MATTNLWQYTNEKYNDMKDEAIIKLIHEGDKSALDFIMNKYKEVVNIKVGKYKVSNEAFVDFIGCFSYNQK